jgi:hypothetical protein
MVTDATAQPIVAHGFRLEALEANRAGILTPQNRRDPSSGAAPSPYSSGSRWACFC